MQESSRKIIDCLERSKIKGAQIIVKARINEVKFNVRNKDIMGGLIQSWLEKFLDSQGIEWDDKGTQAYPDFILENNEYLEVKCYFKDAIPAFDLANFKSFIDSVLKDPKRLNSDYLIFSYSFGDQMRIHDYFCKKIWEMTADMRNGGISSQVKRGTIVNLRPYDFVKDPDRCYKSRYDFVKKIQESIKIYAQQLIDKNCEYRDDEEWFDVLCERYFTFYNHEI